MIGQPPASVPRHPDDPAAMVAPKRLSRFRFIDLFAGIGGFHIAMERLGGRCVFACDIDPDCREIYERNFGLRPHGDIREHTQGDLATFPDHDVLCAGFPCQPFSKSGFQRGMEEARGTLFYEILRILAAKRPRYAILENVRNLAGPRQRHTWEVILRELRALGYRVGSEPLVFSPHLLPPRLGGSPQVRERIFILAEHLGPQATPEQLEGPLLLENRPVAGWDPRSWDVESILDPDDAIPDLGRYRLKPQEVRWIEAWNDLICRLEDDPLPGFPIWADEFRARPNIRPDTPEWKANWLRKNADLYRRNRAVIDRWRAKHDIDSFPESRRKLEWQARGLKPDLWLTAMHFRPSGIRAKPPSYLPALVAITQTSIIGPRRRRITPREAARLQGVPDGLRLHADDATAYRQLGNAVHAGAVGYVATALLRPSPAAPRRPERQGTLQLR